MASNLPWNRDFESFVSSNLATASDQRRPRARPTEEMIDMPNRADASSLSPPPRRRHHHPSTTTTAVRPFLDELARQDPRAPPPRFLVQRRFLGIEIPTEEELNQWANLDDTPPVPAPRVPPPRRRVRSPTRTTATRWDHFEEDDDSQTSLPTEDELRRNRYAANPYRTLYNILLQNGTARQFINAFEQVRDEVKRDSHRLQHIITLSSRRADILQFLNEQVLAGDAKSWIQQHLRSLR